jgi:integrase
MVTGKRGDDLLFSTSAGSPVSRNVFRTRVWLPAIELSGMRQRVRFHDLRGAHASGLLAGGAELKAVMDRLGHKQIQTTRPSEADGRSRYPSLMNCRLFVRPSCQLRQEYGKTTVQG